MTYKSSPELRTVPQFLGHGTGAAKLQAVLKDGLRPRTATGSAGNWHVSVESNPRTIYLTRGYAFYFANNARAKGEDLCLFEINTHLLPPGGFVADEDAVEQSVRGRDRLPKGWGMKRRTAYYRARVRDYSPVGSLNALGTCGFQGVIPPEAITRVCRIPAARAGRIIFSLSDPLISVLNWHIMGGHYEALQQWFFDGGDAFPEELREGFEVFAPRVPA